MAPGDYLRQVVYGWVLFNPDNPPEPAEVSEQMEYIQRCMHEGIEPRAVGEYLGRKLQDLKTRTAKPGEGKYRWALYLGTTLIAEGRTVSRQASTKPAIDAAYAHAQEANPEYVRLFGSQAIEGYRLSIWGPRGGIIEHMRKL